MALLTADDIRFKRFAPTRLREGYNMDDVDDFLEEVINTVEELTRLAQNTAVNTGTFAAVLPPTGELASMPIVRDLKADKKRLEEEVQNLKVDLDKTQNELAEVKNNENTMLAGNNAPNITPSGVIPAVSGDSAQKDAEYAEKIANLNSEISRLQLEYNNIQKINSDLEEQIRALRAGSSTSEDVDSAKAEATILRAQLDSTREEASDLRAQLEQLKASQSISMSHNSASSPEEATTMLSLAQQLHDEVIEKGKNDAAHLVEEANKEKERIIGEGQQEKEKLIGEGETKRDELVEEAHKKAEETYESLARERTDIEQKIEELRQFEKDYRSKIVDTLNNMLSDVKSQSNS